MPSNRTIILQHKDEMVYSKEFFEMRIPKEIDVLFYTICLLCVVLLGVVIFGRIDDVVKADGIVRTQGNVSSVKNVLSGKILELNYKPGQKVEEGDVLYTIDPSDYDIQKENLVMNKEYLELCMKGNESLIKSYYDGKNRVSKADSIPYAKFESYLAEVKKLSIQEGIAQQEYNKELKMPELARVRYNIEMKRKEYNLARSTLEAYKKSFIADLYAEKKDLEMQYEALRQNLTQLENKFVYLSMRAPVTGYIQEVSSLNAGDYVGENTDILNIIPNDSKNFRVEIQVASKDIGKITSGMKVKYRLSAFPYFEYRGAEGVITSVDPDIHSDGKEALYYSVYGDIDRVEFSNRHGDSFPIRAGIETNARIVIGNTTILYYILKKMDFLY